MAFWKKSEDPWDIDPNQRRTVPEPEEVWTALNADNKVSLYTNVNGNVRLFNKNSGD